MLMYPFAEVQVPVKNRDMSTTTAVWHHTCSAVSGQRAAAGVPWCPLDSFYSCCTVLVSITLSVCPVYERVR